MKKIILISLIMSFTTASLAVNGILPVPNPWWVASGATSVSTGLPVDMVYYQPEGINWSTTANSSQYDMIPYVAFSSNNVIYYYWFHVGEQSEANAKVFLSILLTAKSTGSKVFIATLDDYQSQKRFQSVGICKE